MLNNDIGLRKGKQITNYADNMMVTVTLNKLHYHHIETFLIPSQFTTPQKMAGSYTMTRSISSTMKTLVWKLHETPAKKTLVNLQSSQARTSGSSFGNRFDVFCLMWNFKLL